MFYAKPIEAIEQKGKSYSPNFDDLFYQPKDNYRFQFMEDHNANFREGKITVKAKNKTTNQVEKITLIPFGKTILRQVSF